MNLFFQLAILFFLIVILALFVAFLRQKVFKRGRRRPNMLWIFNRGFEHDEISGKHSRTNSSTFSNSSFYQNSSSDDEFASDRKSVGSGSIASGYSSQFDGNVFL